MGLDASPSTRARSYARFIFPDAGQIEILYVSLVSKKNVRSKLEQNVIFYVFVIAKFLGT